MTEPQALALIGLSMAILTGLANLLISSMDVRQDSYLAGPVNMTFDVYMVMTCIGIVLVCIALVWEKFL